MILISRLLAAIAILAFTNSIVFAQELKFYKKYRRDEVNTSEQIRVSRDGNLLLLGTVRRPNSLGQTIRDLLLVKTNLNGDTLWTKHVGRDGRSELGRDFEIRDDGSMLITGYSAYDNGTKVQGFLMCVDAAGNLLWDKYYGNPAVLCAFTSLKIVNDGILLAGTADSSGNSDAFVLKTNPSGDSLWSTTVGGPAYDDAWDVESADDGGYLFAGGTFSYAAGAFDDAWIVKLDADGHFLWRKTFGIPGRVDWAWSFVPSRNSSGLVDGYVFTGVMNAGEEGTAGSLQGDVYLVKVDNNGDVLWDRSLATPAGQLRREGTDIIRTSDGGYALCGFGLSNNKASLYFVRTDQDGNVVHSMLTNNLPETFLPRALVQAPDSSFYITGTITSGTAAPLEILLARIGPADATAIGEPIPDDLCSVYPNPAREYVVIHRTKAMAIAQVDVISMDGRILNSLTAVKDEDVVIPVAAYSGTTVLLRIRSEDGHCYHKRIVIR